MLSASGRQAGGGVLVLLGVLWFLAAGPLNGFQCGGEVCQSVVINWRALLGATVTGTVGLASMWSSAGVSRRSVAAASGILTALAGAVLAYMFLNYYVRFVTPTPLQPREILTHLDFFAFALAGLLIAGVGARSAWRGVRSSGVGAE